MDSTLSDLKRSFPARDIQIERLYDLFAYRDEPLPQNVFIYGASSTGKTAVVTSFLEKLKIRHAVINLIECYTSKILFDTILNKLSGHRITPKSGNVYARCDNLMDFIFHLQKLSHEVDLTGSVIVLDKAEELRNMEFNLLPCFLRFKELTDISVSVIFLSHIIFEKYYFKAHTSNHLHKIYFTQYNKDELLEILSLDIDYVRTMITNNFNESLEFDMEFYRNYLNVFLSVFYRACRDLSELRHMNRINFIKYCTPIINKECTTNNSMLLWRHIAPILKSSLEVLYLRISTDTPLVTPSQSDASKLNINSLTQSLELPFYAKYLLIAAYLASYNSVKDDKRLFMKYHGKKRKTLKDVKLKSKVSEQLNTQLGPKPFTFDRLLAIFYSILQDKVGFNNHLLVQVSSLVELQLLSMTSDNLSLDGRKYKCNVNFDCIQNVSRLVGLNIRKYLSDFSHM